MKVAILGTRGYPYVYGGYETFVSRVAPGLASKVKTIFLLPVPLALALL